MRSDMEALRSPATIMKLAREQGALCEIERLTFFKSLENFDHLRSEGLVRRDTMLFINSIASVCLPREDSEYMESRWHELCRQMVIEITEEEEIDHEALEAKRHVPGFSGMFALDDYGSGFANENSLLELSPRFIKVDIAIIRGIDTTRTSSRSCRTSWPSPTRAACRSLPRAWRPPPSCARSSSWVRMRCRATSLQNLPPYRPKWHLPPARSLPSTALHPTTAEYEHKKSRRNAGLFASATGVLQFAAVYWNRANNSTGGAFLLWYR